MRYSSFVPLVIAGVAAACHDSPMAPDDLESLHQVGGSSPVTATQTAVGIREDRVEFDWTAQRFVKEIHVDSDMHLIPERDRVEILPGETAWITFQVDAQRRVAFEGTVEGVSGQTCVTNTSGSTLRGFAVVESVEQRMEHGWASVAGATTVVFSTDALESAAVRCLPYEILFAMTPGAEYRVVAKVSTTQGRTAAEARAEFTRPNTTTAVEIDSDAWVRDAWFYACRATFGMDFSCMSLETFPRDRHLVVDAAGRASVTFMVDIRNDGVCGETFVYTIDEPLREGGPAPPGGELRSVIGTLVITTGRCEDLTNCPQSAEWWVARLRSHPDEVLAHLPIPLGVEHGTRTIAVIDAVGVEAVLTRFGNPSNGMLELYAQLLTEKLNIRNGADPRPGRDVRIAADIFLGEYHSTAWTSLTASQQAQVWEWAEALEEINERGCPDDDDDDDGDDDDDDGDDDDDDGDDDDDDGDDDDDDGDDDDGAGSCTRTVGYWKNHAGFGPQRDVVTPLLPIWLGTAAGAKSVHVTSAAQAVELLDKSGDASNGINKLYAQLLAAKLNIKNGANGSAIASTIADADAFLSTHAAADWGSLSGADRERVLTWMSTLDSYNNGRLGPGHCD